MKNVIILPSGTEVDFSLFLVATDQTTPKRGPNPKLELKFHDEYSKQYPDRKNPMIIEGKSDVEMFLNCLEKRDGTNVASLRESMGLRSPRGGGSTPYGTVDRLQQIDPDAGMPGNRES